MYSRDSEVRGSNRGSSWIGRLAGWQVGVGGLGNLGFEVCDTVVLTTDDKLEMFWYWYWL